MSDAINDVKEFNTAAGLDCSKFDVKKVGLYKGLQLEELIEGLEAIFKNHTFSNSYGQNVTSVEHDTIVKMKDIMNSFKKGHYDNLIANVDRLELLDSDIDSTYVAIGAAFASGADVEGAWEEIQRSNMSKRNVSTGLMDKDTNGKVIKPSTYSKPNLTPFIKT